MREATADCRGVTDADARRSALSGRAGVDEASSARIDAGFAAPAAIRLEGYPRISFGGRPFFILVVADADSDARAAARWPRPARRAARRPSSKRSPAWRSGPASCGRSSAGCGLAASPAVGRPVVSPNGWAAVDAGETHVFLRQIAGRWRVGAARRGALTVAYADFAARARRRPCGSGRRRDGTPRRPISSLRLSQSGDQSAARRRGVRGRRAARRAPLTLDELRRAGPLGDADRDAAELRR